MQWTRELNDLLNQCVFASGYDFEASSELFCQQAIKLRLWREDRELVVTANQCQEQWMALNPTEDDDNDEEEDKAERPETSDDERSRDTVERVDEEDDYVVVPEGGPRLELSLSDAELDQLLSTLPPSEGPGRSGSSSADEKDTRSEMQWVLAFLTDPDAIACVDAEAKNMMGAPEKHDDDNYQVFLQDLHDANLMAPAPSAVTGIRHSKGQQQTGDEIDRGEESSGDDEAEWERTRQEMKHSKTLR
ncbi:hypothetical protein P3T76_006548 [Phytophthora citrophthora]|uniref:Uncharacterized protein n=1 Tax=Phytophthora citrophthora TaxID=4793 RepID=A0AAD9GQD7_9STRA|nr:hypothetical protein P3T76_006548 [Phytophthora citrophthora]